MSLLDLIMRAVIGLIEGLLVLMPAYSLPASVTNLGNTLGSAVASVNGIFPVVTLGQCLLVLIGALVFKFAWSLVVWIYERIPFL